MLEWRVWRGTAMVLLLSMSWLVNAEQVAITGSVVGPEGEPVAEATVMTKYSPSAASRDRLWAETTTGADGTFELAFECERPSPRYDVLATKRGYALAWQRWEPGQMAQIALGADPATCMGIVVDAKGNPLAGIEVRVRWLELAEGGDAKFLSLGNFASPLATETDEKGRFDLDGLPGTAKVALAARGEGWAYFVHIGPNVPRTGEEVEIRLYPEATISGRVTRDGQPVAEVAVIAAGQDHGWGNAVTAQDGSYTIKHLARGRYNVMLHDIDELTAVALGGVEVAMGEHAQGADLALIQGAIVEGTVTLADTGEPAVGAAVAAYGPARPTTTAMCQPTKADDQGRYRLRLPPGENRIYYQGGFKGYPLAEEKTVWVEVVNGEHKTGVDFVLKPSPRVRGVLLNPDGAPAAGVSVWLAQDALGGTGSEARRTDEQGRFEFTGRRHPREYGWVLFAQDPERHLAAVTIVKDLQEEVIVRLEKGAYVTTQVTDVGGNPVANVSASVVLQKGGGIREGSLPIRPVSDADGFLRIGPLPARRHLKIFPAGEARGKAVNSQTWYRTQFYLEPGATESLQALRLNLAGRTLRGVVMDELEQPVAGASVVCGSGAAGKGITVTTDEVGRFELNGVSAAGRVIVVAVSPDAQRAAGLLCDPDVDVEPVLKLQPLGMVQGVVYDAEGRPQAGLEVRLQGMSGLYSMSHVGLGNIGLSRTKSDEKGRWLLRGLIPGLSYLVYAHDPTGDRRSHADRFVAEAGDMPVVVDIYME